ncbi:MAG TPA: acyl-ACP thioesterase domain-containing protein [Gaiellaceae bacterium]|nr:acyl-ACP thioesterase domain-containing protein [Gaiellaceae bacterium]
MDTLARPPAVGRTFASGRLLRLADMDARGRLRLDALARFLQDLAIDDVRETGWGTPEHIWFVRRIQVDVLMPFLDDDEVDMVTWCSGLATIAAGRRWSISGNRGGHAEVDSVWIHLGPDGRPKRIEGFDVYANAANARRVSARPELDGPPDDATRTPWPLRVTDVDLHGHVNNAVHWQAVEHLLQGRGPNVRRPLRARLDYRDALDLEDELELAVSLDAGRLGVGFVTPTGLKAVATVERLSDR